MIETRTIRVKRSYLVRLVQIYQVDIPADMTDEQIQEWREADPGAFDETVCDFGSLVNEDYEAIDDDELTTAVIS